MLSHRSFNDGEGSVESSPRRKRSFIKRIACTGHADEVDDRDDAAATGAGGDSDWLFGANGDADIEEAEEERVAESTKWKMFDKDEGQRKVVYYTFGNDPLALLTVEKTDEYPQPESNTDVIIKVQASTVSLNDCIFRRGLYLEMISPISVPCTPGSEVVGIIVSVGDRVESDYGFAVGDRVAALTRTGGNARYANVSGASLVKVPKSVSADAAACMVSTYMAAFQACKLVCPEDSSLSGKKVLVTGGTGPLGQALIQFARRAGAKKIYTTAPSYRHAYVRMLMGATPLPLAPSEWLSLVEGSMDIVFDSACQDGYESSRAALNKDGTLVTVGMYSVLQSESVGNFGAPISAKWTKSRASYFMSQTKSYDLWDSFHSDPDQFKSDLETLFIMLKKKEVKPHIVKRVGLGQVAQAQAFIENGKASGGIVCMPWRRIPKDKLSEDATEDDNSFSVSSWYSN